MHTKNHIRAFQAEGRHCYLESSMIMVNKTDYDKALDSYNHISQLADLCSSHGHSN